jgi:hypothetical protein
MRRGFPLGGRRWARAKAVSNARAGMVATDASGEGMAAALREAYAHAWLWWRRYRPWA